MIVLWGTNAAKSLGKLDAKTARRITDHVQSYADTGRGDVKLLKGTNPTTFRLRVGEYRVLFAYDSAAKGIVVRDVLHRREAYR